MMQFYLISQNSRKVSSNLSAEVRVTIGSRNSHLQVKTIPQDSLFTMDGHQLACYYCFDTIIGYEKPANPPLTYLLIDML